ncbi:ABC transporter substrate-binding protein [Lacrimispora xylanolytica]|uniref:ABC transporter substrate-binding protein n=1 Tax=Lacrimispora xylanolytica TaxID=29375 RepID=A0ABY7A9B7_9FIRM|nr:ABC transporter substrate-binding protein [Lacrimispora xylanolytica]WAJ22131.1 ABC transporter substrate-binding protein [Lacrimispora xylanolytica]
MKKRLIALAAAIVLSVTGCSTAAPSGSKQAETSGSIAETAGQQKEAYGVVVIQNGERTITFTSMPQKVLCCNLYSAENMVMLGLKDYIAGRNVPASKAETPLPELADEFAPIPEIEVSHENAVALEADLVIGQISSFQESKWGTYDMFGNKGVNCYTITGTLVKDETIEDVYTDIENLGKIFKVEDRASALIDKMKKEITDIQSAVSDIEETDKVKVFVMDSFKGNEIYTTSAGLQSNLIELAGGINATRNMADSRWFNTSVETLVKTNPDIIIFNDYGQQTMEEKMDFMNNNPALADVTAVKNKAYLTVPLVTVMQNIRSASACKSFAEFFYPEKFKQ